MEAIPEEDGGGRWDRARRSRADRPWLGAFLVIVVVPILIGAAVVLIAGRGVGFEVVRRLTVRKFPDVQWISRADLAQWREDPGRTQPLVLDARTASEYQVSHLRDAAHIDPARPSLRVLRGRAKNDPVVVYSSVGYRGARVSHWLAGQGYTSVLNLTGGSFQWANEDRPVFRDGRPTGQVHPYDQRWGLLLESRYRAPVSYIETPFAAP
ncbi:MAG TPA: rhodanese-like domain-containing protein [Gemmatimonadales bacterium]|nr:rhodanese-like domain-containing protein [Gemmatimonadales bacterium]